MNKFLRECEFALGFYLAALPLLYIFYSMGNIFFWPMLIVLDYTVARFFDERYMMEHFEEIFATPTGRRYKVYLAGILGVYIYLLVKDASLLILLILNELVLFGSGAIMDRMNKKQ